MWIIFDLILLILIDLNWFFDLGVLLNVSATIVSLYFAPGFFFLNLIFSKKFPYPDLLKLAISFGLSVVISGLTLLVFSFFSISVHSLQIIIILVNILGLISVGMRFNNLSKINFPTAKLLERLGTEKLLVISFLAALALVFFSFSWFWVKTESTPAQFTEFYYLGGEGRAEDYISEVEVYTPIKVNIGIANHEGEEKIYHVFAMTEDQVTGYLEAISIADGENWENELVVTFDSIGDDQKLTISLSCEGCDFPYRQLSLWVDIIPGSE